MQRVICWSQGSELCHGFTQMETKVVHSQRVFQVNRNLFAISVGETTSKHAKVLLLLSQLIT